MWFLYIVYVLRHLMWFAMNVMIVPGMFVCSCFLISVCMLIVSKDLHISSATVIVRAEELTGLTPPATLLLKSV